MLQAIFDLTITIVIKSIQDGLCIAQALMFGGFCCEIVTNRLETCHLPRELHKSFSFYNKLKYPFQIFSDKYIFFRNEQTSKVKNQYHNDSIMSYKLSWYLLTNSLLPPSKKKQHPYIKRYTWIPIDSGPSEKKCGELMSCKVIL